MARTIRRPWAVRPAAIASTLLPSGRYDLRERTQVLDGLGRGWPPGCWSARPARTTAAGSCSAAPARRTPAVSEAVAASCAIPSYFAPVPIGGHHHVDGGVHSATNADVLADAGLDVVIVVSPMSAAHGTSRERGRRHAVGDAPAPRARRSGASAPRAPTVVRFEPGPATLAVMGLNAMAEDRSGEVSAAARADARRPRDVRSLGPAARGPGRARRTRAA